MNTCLFTGEVLTPDTKVEHTILDSLGGRVTSRIVASSDFNEQSARQVDLAAKQIYWPVLMNLAHLVPSRVRAAGLNVETPKHKFPCRINKMGQLEIRGTHVERDESGKVKAVYGQDVNSVERLSKQLGLDLKKIQACEPAREDVTFAAMPSVNPLVEVCMLKCILLTFDHLLANDPDRFTRSADLEGCRNVVRDYVLDRVPQDAGRMKLADYSLGLQYEPEYRGRYEQILNKARLESRPFAHQLIVSGNPDTGTLDGDNRDDARRDRLVELIGDELDKAGADILGSESDTPKLGWDHWLKVHRDCFKKLMREFGAPGRLYVQRAEIHRGDPIYLGDGISEQTTLSRE